VALVSSPELTPIAWEIRAEEARALQAGLFPNPRSDLLVENLPGSGGFQHGSQAQVTLQLSQLVELGGKRRARTEAAHRSTDVARSEYEMRRVDVLADVTGKFIDVLERQHALDLAGEAVRLGEATLRTTRFRVQAGATSPAEEKRAAIALSRSRLAEEDIRHELAVSRAALAATWGGTTARFDRVEGDLFARERTPQWEALEQRLVGSPALARQISEEQLREAEIRLAGAKRIPDLTISAGPRWLDRAGAQAVFGFSVPLPFFDRGQAAEAEARARMGRAAAERHATEVRLRALLFRLQQELVHAGHVLDLLQKDILPETREALSIVREGFEHGRSSQLELLDAERTFVEVRREQIEAAASFHRFVLDIERLTGEAIDGPPSTEAIPSHGGIESR
jgi:cobalt-zinc-cadmium efflux system outer membrane protein